MDTDTAELTAEAYLAGLEQFKLGKDQEWINPSGSTTAKLMLILSYPSSEAYERMDLNCGASMVEVKNALETAEINPDDVYITTMCKFGIGSQSKPSTKQSEECTEMLNYEIETIRPRLIMTLGADPFKKIMRANKKVTDYLGEIIDCPYNNCKLLPNYSPGMVLTQDPKLRPFFREVFDHARRFIDDSIQYTPFEWIVVDDPAVNRDIIAHYIEKGLLTVGYDLEWLGVKMMDDEVVYTCQYSCEPHRAIVLDISKDGIHENRELLDTMKPLLEHPRAVRLGWNIRADDRRLVIRGFDIPDETLGFDGMKAVAFIDSRFPKGLETGIRKFTNYKPYYNEFNRALDELKIKKEQMSSLKLLRPDLFYEYCAGDAVSHRTACLAMWERMKQLPQNQQDYWFNTYLPLSHYFLDLELCGIPIDLEVMEGITSRYKTKYEELKVTLLALTQEYGFSSTLMGDRDPVEASKEGMYEDFNPNSSVQKKILLFKKLQVNPAYYTKSGKSPKPRAWYDKQKETVQRQYSPSTNAKSLATIKFDLALQMKNEPENEAIQKKYSVIKTLLDLNRVGVFSQKFLNKRGTDFLTEAEFDEEEEENPLKSSYWNAVCKDGRIHADFFECLNNFRSSSRVNVQNPASKVLSHMPEVFVPGYSMMAKSEQKAAADLIPRNIRHIFYTGDPDWLWAECDCSAADLGIAAYLSGDQLYINDILQGGFHLKKAREYFQDETIGKDDYSKYVSAKAITFRVAYTSELLAAALPIQAEIYSESGIFLDTPRVEYALNTWNRYTKYIAYRERCMKQVEEKQYIENGYGIKYHFEETENFGILAGWMNESLAYPIASELALLLWDISVEMKKELKKDRVWLNYVKPTNSVHDALYWSIHKDLMKDNYFPEMCKYLFTKKCKITTGDTLGLEMTVGDRWKGKEIAFHGETEWNFSTKSWDWKK